MFTYLQAVPERGQMVPGALTNMRPPPYYESNINIFNKYFSLNFLLNKYG
jgi:hypothetical protein